MSGSSCMPGEKIRQLVFKQKNEIKKWRQEGKPWAEIADVLGVEMHTLMRYAYRYGVPRTGRAMSNTTKTIDANKDYIVQRLEAGLSLKDIAEEFGLSYKVFTNKLSALGIKARELKKASHDTETEWDVVADIQEAIARGLTKTEYSIETGLALPVINSICKQNGIEWPRRTRKSTERRPWWKTPEDRKKKPTKNIWAELYQMKKAGLSKEEAMSALGIEPEQFNYYCRQAMIDWDKPLPGQRPFIPVKTIHIATGEITYHREGQVHG